MSRLTLGSTFAGCRLEMVAGRGGMGVVYRATQVGLGRPVAVKAVAPELAGDAEFRQRFTRESHLTASLDHPNVIPVYEAGEFEGTLYLIMRWVDGTDLRALTNNEGRLSPARAVTLLRPVASALAAAHRRGLVHRDVKPANVLIARGTPGEDEHVYLTDFGIARQTDAGRSLTQTGMFVGTVDYSPPERIEGGRGTGASDIYSLGCVLFEVLTGHVPFQRPSTVAKMFAHVNDPVPSASAEAPAVPARFDQIIHRAMAKRPEDRYASAGELVSEMDRALAELKASERIATAPRGDVARLRPAPRIRGVDPAPNPPAAPIRKAAPGPTRPTPSTRQAAPEPTPPNPPTPPTRTAVPAAAADARVGSPAATTRLASATEVGSTRTDRGADSGGRGPSRRGSSAAGGGPRFSRPTLAGLAAGALVAIVVLVIVVVVASGSGDKSKASSTATGGTATTSASTLSTTTAATPTITSSASASPIAAIDGAGLVRITTAALGGAPGSASTYASHLAWVAIPGAGQIASVKSGSAEKTTYAVGGQPRAVAAGRAGVWISGAAAAPLELYQDSGVRARAPLTEVPVAIAVDRKDGSAWASDSSGRVAHLNPDGALAGDAQVLPAPTALGIGEGWVWAVNGAGQGLVRIDPRHYGQTRAFSAGPRPISVAFDQGVWVANADGQVTRFNPQTDKLSVNATLTTGARGLDAIAAAEGRPAVWAISRRGRTLYRIANSHGPSVTGTVVLRSPPVALAADDDDVWVATADGSLLEFGGG